MAEMEIPYNRLSADVLRGLIEDFVSREIGSYTDPDFNLHEQVAKVERMLEKGRARIVYDDEKDHCAIVAKGAF